jgi:hypothetical protein
MSRDAPEFGRDDYALKVPSQTNSLRYAETKKGGSKAALEFLPWVE